MFMRCSHQHAKPSAAALSDCPAAWYRTVALPPRYDVSPQVGFNKLPVIKVLLAAGADVRLTDAKGNTPLHYAAGEPRSTLYA